MSRLQRCDERGVRRAVAGGVDEVVEKREERCGEKEGHRVESLKDSTVQQVLSFLASEEEMASCSPSSHLLLSLTSPCAQLETASAAERLLKCCPDQPTVDQRRPFTVSPISSHFPAPLVPIPTLIRQTRSHGVVDP